MPSKQEVFDEAVDYIIETCKREYGISLSRDEAGKAVALRYSVLEYEHCHRFLPNPQNWNYEA